ncbi:MAG TPA: hypothetical protein VIM71_04080 [Lacunisphaera sp.]
MSHTIDQYFALIGAYTLIVVMILTFALRYCVDDEKVRRAEKPSLLFRSALPPRSMLTDRGLKIWWVRFAAIVVMIVFLVLASATEKKPIQASETTRGK